MTDTIGPLLKVATPDGSVYVAIVRILAISEILAGSDDDELGRCQARAEAGYRSKIDIVDGGAGWTMFSTEAADDLAERYDQILWDWATTLAPS